MELKECVPCPVIGRANEDLVTSSSSEGGTLPPKTDTLAAFVDNTDSSSSVRPDILHGVHKCSHSNSHRSRARHMQSVQDVLGKFNQKVKKVRQKRGKGMGCPQSRAHACYSQSAVRGGVQLYRRKLAMPHVSSGILRAVRKSAHD